MVLQCGAGSIYRGVKVCPRFLLPINLSTLSEIGSKRTVIEMSTDKTPSLYTHSISSSFPSHTPPQSPADSEAHRRWKASLSGNERVEYEKQRIEAMTNTMIRDLRGVSPLCTAPGFYTSEISREHPWPWYSEPRNKEERDQQIATHIKIYEIKTREEQNCFYMSLRERETKWKKEQIRQSQGTRKVTEGRAPEDDEAVTKGSSRGKKSLADNADQSTFKEEYLSPAAYANAWRFIVSIGTFLLCIS